MASDDSFLIGCGPLGEYLRFMREFMLYIRNDGKDLPPNVEQEFLKACEDYIGELQKQGKLISAQPLGDEGRIVSKSPKSWVEQPYQASAEINAGYYHIWANNLADAVAIAKRNPEFRYRPTAKIEVRDIKTEEDPTGYVYPSDAPKRS